MYNKDEPATIRALFDNIAVRYDLANSLMSFHLHAFWNRALSSQLVEKSEPKQLLDLCAGTGEIAIRMHRHIEKKKRSPCSIHLVDFSKEMLEVAKRRAGDLPFTFSQGDATALTFQDGSFDAVSIAYGIRNVKEVRKCIKEVYRILTPNGWLGIVELTRPHNAILKALHALYLRTVVPLIGKWAVQNEEAYKYLRATIHSFICPEELVQILKEEGFSHVEKKPLTGGIATLIFAQK